MNYDKRYEPMYIKYAGLIVADMSTNPRICSAKRFSDDEIVDLLNNQDKKLAEIKDIVNNFHVFFNNLPMGCISNVDEAYHVMKKMYSTLYHIKTIVENDD